MASLIFATFLGKLAGLLLTLFLLYIGLAVAAMVPVLGGMAPSIALAFLTTVGGPGMCEPGGGPVIVNEANASAMQRKWDVFQATLDDGSPATVTFSESELTSRIQRRIDKETERIDVRICLHDRYAEATARLDLPAFLDIKARAKGTLDFGDDEHPTANMDDLDIGSLPWPLTEVFEAGAEGALSLALLSVDLEGHTYTPTFTEGALRIDAEP